jgi:hypothetical protein
MPNYRRAFIPGGCWFFIINLLERRQTLLIDHIDSLRQAVTWTLQKHPFEIDASVVSSASRAGARDTKREIRNRRCKEPSLPTCWICHASHL